MKIKRLREGAEGESRTRMSLRSHAPETCASTSSATSAFGGAKIAKASILTNILQNLF